MTRTMIVLAEPGKVQTEYFDPNMWVVLISTTDTVIGCDHETSDGNNH